MRTLSRKRSSCASGSGYVPSCSIGFCVASTMNGGVERMRRALDRHLAFLHHLEQRGLRLRRRAVDLVGEQQVGEHRPAARGELAGRLVVERVAGDVGRHQVGRELDAREAAVEASSRARARAASCPGRARLRSARGRRRAARRSVCSTTSAWPTIARAICARIAPTTLTACSSCSARNSVRRH